MKASTPSRIITVSSTAHRYGRINRTDLNMENSYNQYQAYFQSKLANVLFARSLASRLSGTSVTSNSLHPGIVHLKILISPLTLFMKTPKSGAQTSIMLAVDPALEQVSGQYFADCRITNESGAARDDEMAEWLWEASEYMVHKDNALY
ncbi:retinol dehydrogenase 14-like [Contarinia nasturtii]|uniref:retinol dehydrogenase 14-like n=1 Tax=Contarinia nasturtii TaxID=265458 RepID=UPI0012D3E120|nr:retinol dehydrogenase 14-like [Contarinia nasturtii]